MGNKTENMELNIILLLLNMRTICAKIETCHGCSRCIVVENVIVFFFFLVETSPLCIITIILKVEYSSKT